ncbi:unnamed protein product [Polarella glacialis]|nr:unnamed protein product [Polarella glacialis]
MERYQPLRTEPLLARERLSSAFLGLCWSALMLGSLCVGVVLVQPAARTSSSGLVAQRLQLWTWGGVWNSSVENTRKAEDAASKAAHEAANSSWAKLAVNKTQHVSHRIQEAAHEIANSPEMKRLTKEGSEDKQALSDDPTVKRAEVETEKAMHEIGAAPLHVINKVCGGIADYTIPPRCLHEMEFAAVLASGAAVSPLLIRAVGFETKGVAARSLASLWQRLMGDVKEGSFFAKLQSAAAKGELVTESLRLVGASAVSACVFCETSAYFFEEAMNTTTHLDREGPG